MFTGILITAAKIFFNTISIILAVYFGLSLIGLTSKLFNKLLSRKKK